MFADTTTKPACITESEISERFWSFGSAGGELFARNVVLARNGQVLHYSSPNERSWRIEGEQLVLIAEGGGVSARLSPVRSHRAGRLRFEGEHCIGGPSGIMLAFQETGLDYPVFFHWTQGMEDYLASLPIFLTTPFRTRGVYAVGQLIKLNKEALVEPYASLPFGCFISVGAFSYCHGGFPSGTASIGRYCSIAAGARPFGPAHPIERISSAGFSYDPYYVDIAKQFGVHDYTQEPYDQDGKEIHIEHDVWIGEDVMIKGGVTIGTGSVIGARSMITKDVPQYSIVVGTPGRVLRQRFAPRIVEGLLTSRWWTYNFSFLPRCMANPERFIEELKRLVDEGRIESWEPDRVDIARDLLRIID